MKIVEKIEILYKKMTDMEEKITKAVTDNLKDLLTQIIEKQQPKQEVTIKEENEEKKTVTKMCNGKIILFCDIYIYRERETNRLTIPFIRIIGIIKLTIYDFKTKINPLTI